jgi:hypothetical protein
VTGPLCNPNLILMERKRCESPGLGTAATRYSSHFYVRKISRIWTKLHFELLCQMLHLVKSFSRKLRHGYCVIFTRLR